MTDAVLGLAPPALAGAAFGVVYFGVLWLSVRHALGSDHTVAWLAASAAVRIAILLFGFYVVMDGHWQRLAACLAGFIVARVCANAVVRLTGPPLQAAR